MKENIDILRQLIIGVFKQTDLFDLIASFQYRGYFGLIFLVSGLLILVASLAGSSWVLLIVSLSVIILGFLFLSYRRIEYEKAVEAFDEGIRICERGQKEDIFWEDIAAVYHKNILTEKVLLEIYVIKLKNGLYRSFGEGMEGRSQLSRMIEDGTTDRLLQKALDDYYNHKPVRFGNYIVVKNGVLSVNDTSVDIPNIHSIVIVDNDMLLRVLGLFAPKVPTKVYLPATPNALIFKAMVYEIIERETGRRI